MAKNNLSKLLNCVAFVGLIMVAIVLIFQQFNFSGSVFNALRTVGEAIAYLITAICAFFYVRSKRNIWWYVAYTVAVVLVIIFMIIRPI